LALALGYRIRSCHDQSTSRDRRAVKIPIGAPTASSPWLRGSAVRIDDGALIRIVCSVSCDVGLLRVLAALREDGSTGGRNCFTQRRKAAKSGRTIRRTKFDHRWHG
jgi:hypothetical protein